MEKLLLIAFPVP